MVLPVVTDATLAQDIPTTAKIWKMMVAMLLAAITVALICPSTAVCAACATPHSIPLRIMGEAVRIYGRR